MTRTRAEARALGLPRYFTGKPCPRGHTAERYTASRACVECQNIFTKRWNRNNFERYSANSRRWERENPDKHAAIQRRHYANPETLANSLAVLKAWRLANPDRVKQAQKENARAWAKANRGKMRDNDERRRARERLPLWADRAAIAAVYQACPPDMEVDHIVPLGSNKRVARTVEGFPISGLHVPWNLQYLPRTDNKLKSHRMRPEDQALCLVSHT